MSDDDLRALSAGKMDCHGASSGSYADAHKPTPMQISKGDVVRIVCNSSKYRSMEALVRGTKMFGADSCESHWLDLSGLVPRC